MNRVIIGGRLGQDPEIRHTAHGMAILRLRIATTERFKSGEKWEERAEWHDVVVFGKRAEGLHRLLRKGEYIAAEGRLRTSSWQDNQGMKRYRTEIIADEVELTGSGGGDRGRDRRSGPDDSGRDHVRPGRALQQDESTQRQQPMFGSDDSDIPF